MENKNTPLHDLLQQASELILSVEEEEEEAADEPAPQFGLPEYWDERYINDQDPYEWFISWTDTGDKLANIFCNQKFDKALNLGCGNSPMFLHIQDHFNEIYNIDISGVVIDQMKEKYKDNKKQLWQKMDCTQLNFPDSFFDVVFDKATLDAIMCGEDSKNKVHKSIIELFRVLKVGGLFVDITCGLFMPTFKEGSQFRGKRLHWDLIHSEKLLNPKIKEQIVYIFVFRKLSNDFDENGCDDDNFIHNTDDDFLLKLCSDDVDKKMF